MFLYKILKNFSKILSKKQSEGNYIGGGIFSSDCVAVLSNIILGWFQNGTNHKHSGKRTWYSRA